MSEQRERPQYGEYASIDEQVAAGGYEVEPEPAPAAQLAPPLATTRVVGAPPAQRPWDRALTVALLAFGAINIFSSIPGLLDFGAAINQGATAMGMKGDVNLVTASHVGVAVLVIQLVVFAATVVVSVLRLRARKLAFFVPLLGFAVFFIAILAVMFIAVIVDPTFASFGA